MAKAESIGDGITRVLKTPIAEADHQPEIGFEALEDDGSTKLDLSEQVLAAMARAALTRGLPGVIFNEITAHRDEAGQLMRIEVAHMDSIHDPSPRSITVAYE